MIIVACVEVGNYLGRGAEYVAKLRAMVARNLSAPHTFICLSDDYRRHAPRHDSRERDFIHELPEPGFGIPGLVGWWAKLYLFSPMRFAPRTRVLFLDLDTVIVGSLDALVESKGILHLADWGWTKNDYGSGVMVWDAGEHEEIWTRYTPDVPQRFRGDQDWMTYLGGWPALPKGLCVSYRYVSKQAPPAGARAVCMHGTPKPHEILTGWVPELWK